jgi:flagellin
MLSLHTNAAALSAQNSIGRTQSGLSTSMTRLSTGFRINSAMDDAAAQHPEFDFHAADR